MRTLGWTIGLALLAGCGAEPAGGQMVAAGGCRALSAEGLTAPAVASDLAVLLMEFAPGQATDLVMRVFDTDGTLRGTLWADQVHARDIQIIEGAGDPSATLEVLQDLDGDGALGAGEHAWLTSFSRCPDAFVHAEQHRVTSVSEAPLQALELELTVPKAAFGVHVRVVEVSTGAVRAAWRGQVVGQRFLRLPGVRDPNQAYDVEVLHDERSLGFYRLPAGAADAQQVDLAARTVCDQ